MVDTLIKLGEQLSENYSKWDDHLEKRESKIYAGDNKDRTKTKFVLNIVFDVDKQEILVSPENLEQFSAKTSITKHWLLQTKGGNARKTYTAVLLNNIEHLKISLIEKPDTNNPDKLLDGDFMKDIDNKYQKIKDTPFYQALESLKVFKGKTDILSKDEIIKQTNINRNSEAIVFCYASIINSELNIQTKTELSKLDGFEAYMNTRFFKPTKAKQNKAAKLCYASGELKEDVEVSADNTRATFSSMFVQKTKNYANDFSDKNFHKNFQLSREHKIFIQRAGDFLTKNYKVRIAGLEHIIFPQVLSKSKIDFQLALSRIKQNSDFLLKHTELKQINTKFTVWLENEPYWLNFLEADITPGQSFKTGELIKDVSTLYFVKLLKTIEDVSIDLQDFLKNKHAFNLYTIYKYIPVKYISKKKKKVAPFRNAALLIFKDIFEQRPIEKQLLYKHFTKYLICQRSGQFEEGEIRRHQAYRNISEQTNFDYAISNAVNTYLAFFEILKKLNLLNNNNMDENNEVVQPIETATNDYAKRVEAFFEKMAYTEQQKALFYLGRVLSQIAYAQYQKNHKNKPVLNKINYNGMDKDDIIRFRVDLAEKARQYNIVSKVDFNFLRFTEFFNPNDKHLSPNENVFFILSGYSFGITKKETSEDDKTKEENEKE